MTDQELYIEHMDRPHDGYSRNSAADFLGWIILAILVGIAIVFFTEQYKINPKRTILTTLRWVLSVVCFYGGITLLGLLLKVWLEG